MAKRSPRCWFFARSNLSSGGPCRLKEKGRIFREAFLAKLALLLRGTVQAPPDRFGETLADEHIRGGTPPPFFSPAQRLRYQDKACASVSKKRFLHVWKSASVGATSHYSFPSSPVLGGVGRCQVGHISCGACREISLINMARWFMVFWIQIAASMDICDCVFKSVYSLVQGLQGHT